MTCLSNIENGLPAVNEWDQMVSKIGALTLAAGYLEMAIIALVCRILGKSENELGRHNNKWWCEKLQKVAPPSWSDAQKKDLSQRLLEIRALYLRRNRMIHAALGMAADGSISGVPSGSIVDLRTYGVGFSKQEGNIWTIGVIAERFHLNEIDKLIDELHKARVGLSPYMDLVDEIKHQPKPFPIPKVGKLLSD
jgi:hypothetical protein